MLSSCRIDSGFVIKVADFGLSECIDTARQYFRQRQDANMKLPIKWLAPESITDGIFSEKTDVVCELIHLHVHRNTGVASHHLSS